MSAEKRPVIVERISLRNFRRFREAEFSLGEGINVVKGPNESGKSTLLQAVLAAFYWKADSTRREVRESVTWGEGDGFRLEIEGIAGEGHFRLVKDFSARRATLYWEEGETSDATRIEERVRDWLGLGSEAAFRATAGIRQDEVALIAEGGKQLGESLQVTVSGLEGGKGALRARDALRKELGDLLRGKRGAAVKNPGPLAEVEERIKVLRARGDELARAAEERLAARRSLAELEGEERVARERLEVLGNLARDSQERLEIEEDIEDFHRRYGQLAAAAELIAEDEELAELEKSKYTGVKALLEKERSELGDLELRRAGLAEQYRTVRRKLESAASSRHAPWAPWLLVAGMTAVLVGVAGVAFSPYLLLLALPGIALLLAALLPGGYLGFLREGRQARELRFQVAALEERREELDAEALRMVSRAGCASVQDFEALRMEYLELLARRKEIADKLEVLVPDGETSGLEERARRLAMEVGMRERRLKELQGRVVDPLRLQEVLREMEVLRRRLDGLREERVRCEVVLSGEEVEEELLRVEEELAELEERRTRLSRRAEALQLALGWLERASGETLTSAARQLERLAGDYLERITGGRYGRVMVDGSTLDLSVWSPEKGGPVAPTSLSRGTVDQLYLAARLSLVEVLCGKRNPPLLLDDPFVTFDSVRLRSAMQLLREYARGGQVVIFTCGNAYDAFADRVVELGLA